MNNNFHNVAEPFIFDFKQSIDDIYEKYGKESLLDSLADAGKDYDVMSRDELEEIMALLANLKTHVDSLFEECLSTSVQSETSDGAVLKTPGSEHISLIEMLKALES